MKRSFLYLLVLTALATAAVVLFAPYDPESADAVADTLFLPEMAKKINQVDRVEIMTAGNTPVATLIKQEENWQVEQMGGYRADWPKLHTLLAALARAHVIEVKTSNPEYYPRLGVEDVVSQDAASVLVSLTAPDQTIGVLVGNRSQGRDGQYVRLQDVAASALIDQKLDAPTKQLEWVDKRIIDINAAEVAEVEIIHSDAGRVLVTRISADQTDFDLVDLPQDREILNSWAVNSLGSVLSMLDLDSVRPAGAVDWSNAVRLRLLIFSGVEIMADMVETDDLNLLRLQASHPAAELATLSGNDSTATLAGEDVANRVAEINQRVNGWVYGIARYKYDAMVKKPEDLLKPVESP